MDEPKVFGIVALKGGVGKTTMVANLGAALAQEFNKKVLLIDANFSTPHLGLHVGVINPEYHLHPALNDEYSIYESIYQHPLGFHIIPGKLAPTEVNMHALKEKIEPLKEIYDVILIDSSPALNQEMASAINAADEIIVVSSPDYPTLSSTLHAIRVAQEQNTPIKGIVLNKVRKKKFELCKKDIAKASEVDVLASIPENIKALASLSKMVPVVSYSPAQDISKSLKELARKIIGEKKKSKFAKLKEKITKSKKKEKKKSTKSKSKKKK